MLLCVHELLWDFCALKQEICSKIEQPTCITSEKISMNQKSPEEYLIRRIFTSLCVAWEAKAEGFKKKNYIRAWTLVLLKTEGRLHANGRTIWLGMAVCISTLCLSMVVYASVTLVLSMAVCISTLCWAWLYASVTLVLGSQRQAGFQSLLALQSCQSVNSGFSERSCYKK